MAVILWQARQLFLRACHQEYRPGRNSFRHCTGAHVFAHYHKTMALLEETKGAEQVIEECPWKLLYSISVCNSHERYRLPQAFPET